MSKEEEMVTREFDRFIESVKALETDLCDHLRKHKVHPDHALAAMTHVMSAIVVQLSSSEQSAMLLTKGLTEAITASVIVMAKRHHRS